MKRVYPLDVRGARSVAQHSLASRCALQDRNELADHPMSPVRRTPLSAGDECGLRELLPLIGGEPERHHCVVGGRVGNDFEEAHFLSGRILVKEYAPKLWLHLSVTDHELEGDVFQWIAHQARVALGFLRSSGKGGAVEEEEDVDGEEDTVPQPEPTPVG